MLRAVATGDQVDRPATAVAGHGGRHAGGLSRCQGLVRIWVRVRERAGVRAWVRLDADYWQGGARLPRRFWERDDGIHGGYSFLDDPNLILMYPSQGLGQDAGLVTLYYPASRDSLRITGLDPEVRIQAGLRDLEFLHPGVRQDLRLAVSVAWSRIPWSAGCAGAWTAKARQRDLPRLAAGDRRVLFAGEHVSHIPAWMEGSVQSAHAALEVLQQQWRSQAEAV
jgi:monoamine oxidase